MVTCEPVSIKQRHLCPDISTNAMHLAPTKPLGSLTFKFGFLGHWLQVEALVLVGLVSISVPICPSIGTGSSLKPLS